VTITATSILLQIDSLAARPIHRPVVDRFQTTCGWTPQLGMFKPAGKPPRAAPSSLFGVRVRLRNFPLVAEYRPAIMILRELVQKHDAEAR
jgi:hypothetical protein